MKASHDNRIFSYNIFAISQVTVLRWLKSICKDIISSWFKKILGLFQPGYLLHWWSENNEGGGCRCCICEMWSPTGSPILGEEPRGIFSGFGQRHEWRWLISIPTPLDHIHHQLVVASSNVTSFLMWCISAIVCFSKEKNQAFVANLQIKQGEFHLKDLKRIMSWWYSLVMLNMLAKVSILFIMHQGLRSHGWTGASHERIGNLGNEHSDVEAPIADTLSTTVPYLTWEKCHTIHLK